MIRIDLRDTRPAALIGNGFSYWTNVMSLAWYVLWAFLSRHFDCLGASYYLMEWFMLVRANVFITLLV